MNFTCVAVESATSNVRRMRSGANGRGTMDGNALDDEVRTVWKSVGSRHLPAAVVLSQVWTWNRRRAVKRPSSASGSFGSSSALTATVLTGLRPESLIVSDGLV